MGYYSFSKTTNKSSCRNKTFMSHTIKVLNTEGSFSQQSSFRSALGLQQVTLRVEGLENFLLNKFCLSIPIIQSYLFICHFLGDEDKYSEEISSISARDFILAQCGQEDVLPFEEYFNERYYFTCSNVTILSEFFFFFKQRKNFIKASETQPRHPDSVELKV